MAFRELSVTLTETLDKQTKQSQGIFFTPKEARDQVFNVLKRFRVKPTSILEPSFGSGEFLEDLYRIYPSATITGVELNPTLFASSARPNLFNQDFLEYQGQHDLIVGNPPYVVIPASSETQKCQTGRPNLFVQFLYKAVRDNLTEGGVLAFVLPTSLFNCVYYDLLRAYLYATTTLLAVTPLEGAYLETQQATVALVLRKKKGRHTFFLPRAGNHYITPHYRALRALLKGSTTLKALGFRVKTGDVVWNQVKEKLADTGTLLLYSSNFSTGEVILNTLAPPKKQYIQGFGRTPLSGQSILINRGYGNTTYALTAVVVDYPSYYAENHVNVILPETDEARAHIPAVFASLQSPRTNDFIRMFVGNGALSKTELEQCLPIWLD